MSRPPWGQRPPEPAPLCALPDGTAATDGSAGGEALAAVLSRYAALLQIPVSLHVAPNRFSRPRSGGLHVHAFALPTLPVLFGIWPRVLLTPLPFAYGVPLRDGAHWAMSPGYQLGRGQPLTDLDGNTVAEYVGTNLYCLFDMLGQDPEERPLLLRRHLDLGLPRVLGDLAQEAGRPEEALRTAAERLRHETERLVRVSRQQRHEAARQAYAASCQTRVAEEICSLRAEIALLEDGVEELARGITKATRRLLESQSRLASPDDGPASPGADLDAPRLPEVTEVAWQGRGIRAVTAPIRVEHDGRVYSLGRFQVDLSMDGDVRIANLTGRVGEDDHPHVHGGRPRLANVREGLAKLLGEGQLPEAL
ncbi:MAG: hypothetical protein ACE147_17015, partial [Candidatus Methylomirabilales bacterium]